MNKKITLYELLGLIKDGKAPRKVKGRLDKIYTYHNYCKDYIDDEGKLLFANLCLLIDKCLDDEVEILDDEDIEDKTKPLTKKDIEALGYACGEIKKCFEMGWNKSLNNEQLDEDMEIEEIKLIELSSNGILNDTYTDERHYLTANLKDKDIYVRKINQLIKNQQILVREINKLKKGK